MLFLSGRTRLGTLAGMLYACALLADCKGRALPEGQCVFDSDCDGGLVCAGGFCRAVCNADAGARADADCAQFGAGFHCRPSGVMGRSVCLPPTEEGYCVYHSECSPPLVCNRDGRCGPQCRENRDCVAISLDPSATCQPDGTCSFRDGGASGTDATTDATAPADTATADTSTADTQPAAD